MERSTIHQATPPTPDDRRQRNRGILLTLAMLCTVMLLLVSTLPTVLIPPALSQLLVYASLGAVVVAMFRRERMFPRHLTHWDQAAALTFLSLVVGAFTDLESLGAFLESQAVGGAATGS